MADSPAAATERLREHLSTLALGGGHPLMVVVPRDALSEALAERERLIAGLEELLDVAERIRGGDSKLDPEQWYATSEYARKVLHDSGN